MTDITERTTIKIEGRKKDFNPLPRNKPLHYLVEEFNKTGKALFVIEPGDLTRYTFILVKNVDAPKWHGEVWFILPLSGMSGKVATDDLGFEPKYVAPFDFEWMSNFHSQRFTAAWIEWFYQVLNGETNDA